MLCTKPDVLAITHDGVAFVSSDAVSSFWEFALNAPMGIPSFGYCVLDDHPITELKFGARELGTAFFDFFGFLQPSFHVMC